MPMLSTDAIKSELTSKCADELADIVPGVVVCDPNGDVVFICRIAARLLGVEGPQVTGKPLDVVVERSGLLSEITERLGASSRAEGRWAVGEIGERRTFGYRAKFAEIEERSRIVISFHDVTAQAQVEQELRDKRHTLELVLASMREVVIIIDPTTRTILGCNDVLAEMLGCSREMLIGASTRVLFDSEEEYREFGKAIPELMSMRSASISGRCLLGANGKRFEFECSMTRMSDDPNDMRMVNVMREVSEHRAAQDELGRLQRLSEAIFNNAPTGIQIFDDKGFSVRMNEAQRKILGLPDCNIGVGVFNILTDPWVVAQGLQEVHQRVYDGEIIEQVDVPYDLDTDAGGWPTKGGKHVMHLLQFPMKSDAGKVEAVVQFTSDVTERYQADQALRHSEYKFRRVFDNAAVGMALLDMQLNPLVVNGALARILGMTPEDALKAHPVTVTHPDDRERARADLEALIRGEVDSTEIDKRYVRPDGSTVWVHVSTCLLRDRDNNPEFLLPIVLDINDRKLAEEAQHAASKRAEEASAAKDRFIATLSHELRTPMTPVLATVDALLARHDLRPDVRQDLQMVKRNVEIEARLIDDLLDINRIARGKFSVQAEPSDVHAAVRDAVQTIHPQADARGLTVEMSLESAAHVVMIDPARLRQVFWNLLSNAVKFSSDGGTVRCSTREHDKQIEISVSDDGIGIESGDLGRIFDPFVQAEGLPGPGLGIGLSLSRSIVTGAGGDLSVASEGIHRGSVFTVRLPLVDQPLAKPPAQNSSDQVAGLKLLLVEDHADARKAMARLLRMNGLQVETAESLAEAGAKLKGHSYDVVLSDVLLGDGTGVDLMKEVRARGDQTPAIAMSGLGMPSDLAATAEAGFNVHLVKPLNVRKLIDTIAQQTGRATADV